MASPFTSFSGKVYAITGLAGMGQSIARLLLQHGASVSLADISQQALDTAVTALGGDSNKSRLLAMRVDVGDWAQVEGWISATIDRFGRLDGAANFAGAIGKNHGMKELVEQDEEDWELIMRVNLTGLMYCVKAQLRAMKALKQAETEPLSRSIVNAASIQGVKGFPKHVAYSTSKHGAIGLTRSVALEVAKDDIRVNCVAP
jgi:NAD(P)-dependent dehydrogenase (short-subunit alcohol dehydrogenase family)